MSAYEKKKNYSKIKVPKINETKKLDILKPQPTAKKRKNLGQKKSIIGWLLFPVEIIQVCTLVGLKKTILYVMCAFA